MSTWIKDVRYASRSLAKRPLLTATVALTLALGLGANAAIFNLIDRLVLRPFPALDPDNVVMIEETGPGLDLSPRDGVAGELPRLARWDGHADQSLGDSVVGRQSRRRGEPERFEGMQVSWGFFDALGIRPALGRGFVSDDETFGHHRVVVLSDAVVEAALRE